VNGMDDQIPADLVTDLLLPDDLRAELCIATVTIADSHRLLRFRIDPGNAFERHGYLRTFDGTRFLIGIAERYLPSDKNTHVCGSDGIPASDIPGQLRTLSGWAYTWDTNREPWRFAYRRRIPAWSAQHKVITTATFAAGQCASQEHVTYYLCGRPGEYTYSNHPPGTATPFYSITPLGDWSLHDGTATYPMAAAPDASSVARHTSRETVRNRHTRPVAVAQADRADGDLVVIPFLGRDSTSRQDTVSRRRRR
jgi:hypothetical protein